MRNIFLFLTILFIFISCNSTTNKKMTGTYVLSSGNLVENYVDMMDQSKWNKLTVVKKIVFKGDKASMILNLNNQQQQTAFMSYHIDGKTLFSMTHKRKCTIYNC